MSLTSSRLENIVPRGDGSFNARCPACAAEGRDNAGNHLIVFASGRYACVLFSGQGEEARAHRRQIFALAGDPNAPKDTKDGSKGGPKTARTARAGGGLRPVWPVVRSWCERLAGPGAGAEGRKP